MHDRLAAAAAYRIAVIGAGCAGSVCATRLVQIPGIATSIYDMGSRGPGGRACSRPVDGRGGSFSPDDRGGASSLDSLPADIDQLVFDHGVQAFTVNKDEADSQVTALLDKWLEDGHVKEWKGRFGVVDASTGAFSESAPVSEGEDPFDLLHPDARRYVGAPSMGHLVSEMLEHAQRDRCGNGGADDAASPSLTLLTGGCKATSITYDAAGGGAGARWTVASSDGCTREFDAVVVAGHAASLAANVAAALPPLTEHPPAAAAAAMSQPPGCAAAGNTLASPSLTSLREVSYPDGTAPLYALLVAFPAPLGDLAPFDGAAVRGHPTLRWLSRESSKPGRERADGLELWVAHSTHAWASDVASTLPEGATPLPQGGKRPTEAQLQTVAKEMLAAFGEVLGTRALPSPVYLHAQRWQAGVTRTPLDLQPSPCAAWPAHGLVACGDWAARRATIAEAARSGLAAADAAERLAEAARHMRGLLLTTAMAAEDPAEAERLRSRALAEWDEWQCEPTRFFESRWWEAPGREEAAEERCLITEGHATLWPAAGGAGVEIRAGEWVTFRRGFLCTWVVHTPIAKRYAYFTSAGVQL